MTDEAYHQLDAIIVGGGLAGIHLALAMDRTGLRALVVDRPDHLSSSRIAAGIINPITGRRFALSWMYPQLESVFTEVYRYWESRWNSRFFNPVKIYRSVPHNKLVNDLDAKLTDQTYQPYCRPMTPDELQQAGEMMRFTGPGYVMHGYRLDTEGFLDQGIRYLSSKGLYQTGTIEGSVYQLDSTSFEYNSFRSNRMIWATGAAIVKHPLFSWVGMNPNKGEILRLQADDSEARAIVKQTAFYIPEQHNRWWIGTFDSWDTVDVNPSEKGRDYLLGKAAALRQPYVEIDHVAAIRPAVEDRRPVIGPHPLNHQIYLFNGFGSKGTSLIPFFAKMLVDHMMVGQSIQKEADARRYWRG